MLRTTAVSVANYCPKSVCEFGNTLLRAVRNYIIMRTLYIYIYIYICKHIIYVYAHIVFQHFRYRFQRFRGGGLGISDTDFNVSEKVVLIPNISDTDFKVSEKVLLILNISDIDFSMFQKVMLILDISYQKSLLI